MSVLSIKRTICIDDNVPTEVYVLERCPITNLYSIRNDTVVKLDTASEQRRTISTKNEQNEAWPGQRALFSDDNIVHDDGIRQLGPLTDETALADDASLDADLFAQVRVDRWVKERVW